MELTNLNELAAALAKAQGEFSPVGVNRENTFFKSSYADLDAIIMATRPSLSKNGISFLQFTSFGEDGATILITRLLHSSGQFIDGKIRIIPDKNDVQSFGKVLTYHKRYAAMSILGVTSSSDMHDDDGNVAVAAPQERLAQWQISNISNALSGRTDIHSDLLKAYAIESVVDLDPRKYNLVMETIAKRKQNPKAVNNS